MNSEPDSLDPHELLVSSHLILYAHLYDKLLDLDANMRPVPQLALSWSTSPDGLTWTFRLRPDAKFHDGTPVDAEAVKFSIDRVLTGFWRSWYDSVDKVAVVDRHTISISTKRRYLFLPHRLAFQPASIVSQSAASKVERRAFGTSPVGSGPYFLREWVRGSRIVLQKNRAHWQAQQNNIDTIEFRFVPDDASRVIALETGEVDFATLLPPHEFVRLRTNTNLRTYRVSQNHIEGLYLNMTKKPFSEIKVRQAIAHALDRQAILKAFWAGYGRLADSPLAPAIWGYKAQPPFEYNPAKARQLLSDAGYRNGFGATMWASIGTNVDETQKAQAVAGMLRQVGITVKVEVLETGRWLDLLRKPPSESALEMAFRSAFNLTGEPDSTLNQLYHTSQWAPRGPNRNFYSNLEVDALVERASTLTSDAERRRVIEKIQEIIWKDQPWIYIAYGDTLMAGKRGLSDIVFLPTAVIHFRNATFEPR